MPHVEPLSALTEHLQALAKSKHDDSIMTGREFVEEYSPEPAPHDLTNEPNKTIATAGGDIQTAYSKVYNTYQQAKNANDQNENEFKVKGEATQSLNTDVLVGHLDIAVDRLHEAAEKLESVDCGDVAADAREIATQVDAHRERIENTGMVVVR